MEPPSINETESEKILENLENVSDRESSIESFHTNKSELSIPTEAELIDIDDIELSDEESWLYKSPKKVSSEEKSACTQKWLQSNVEDMDDEELKETRHALVSKLNQLKYRNLRVGGKESFNEVKASSPIAADKIDVVCNVDSCDLKKTPVSLKSEDVATPDNERRGSNPECQEWKSSQVFDVVDVQKIARLQEESLKQSTYKFLSHSGNRTPSSRDLSPVSPTIAQNLNKPASVEALNTCSDKANHSNVYSMVALQGMKKQSIFNSSSALNSSPEFHRGSLPNINKGYYSLKSRKSKRPSEPKVSCPLPIYPTHSKVTFNGSALQASLDHKSFPSAYDHRESHTLPSSYRVSSRRNSSNSRSNSSSRKDLSAQSPSPRRESMPFTGSSSPLPNHRENYRKFSSPVPSIAYARYATSATVSPTKAFNAQPLRSPTGAEYHRAASHSPARRLPLSMVQHQSPKKENSMRNEDFRQLPVKVPSKIPSPAMRSGIPVPSTCTSGPGDDTWSQDCF